MRAAQWIYKAEVELAPLHNDSDKCPLLEDLISRIEDSDAKLFALTVNDSYCHGDITVSEFLPDAELKVFFKGELVLHAQRTLVQ